MLYAGSNWGQNHSKMSNVTLVDLLNNVTFVPSRKDNIQFVNGQIGVMKKEQYHL